MLKQAMEFPDVVSRYIARVVLPAMNIHHQHYILGPRHPLDRLHGPTKLTPIPIIPFLVELDITELEAMIRFLGGIRFVLI